MSTLTLQFLLQTRQTDRTGGLYTRRAAERQYHPFGRLRLWLVVEPLAEPGCAIFRLQDNLPPAPVEFTLAPADSTGPGQPAARLQGGNLSLAIGFRPLNHPQDEKQH